MSNRSAGGDAEITSQTVDNNNDLANVYDKIKKNKARFTLDPLSDTTDEEDDDEDRPMPSFRVYRVDSETGEKHLVPPFTRPEDFEQMLAANRKGSDNKDLTSNSYDGFSERDSDPDNSDAQIDEEEMDKLRKEMSVSRSQNRVGDYNEQTYDGYVDIQEANGAESREEELDAGKKARMSNRSSGGDYPPLW